MIAQQAKIEYGSGASMLEAIFDVRGNSVLSRAAGPCRKRAVVMLRDPRLPAVIVRGHPQSDWVCVLIVGHVQPSLEHRRAPLVSDGLNLTSPYTTVPHQGAAVGVRVHA